MTEIPQPQRSVSEEIAAELLRATGSIRRTSRRRSTRPVELAALTGTQLELARLVRRRPGISVTDAARELRLAANTVSTLVRELTDRRIVVRRVDADDRRIARLKLSEDIRRKIDDWRDRRVVALGAAVEALPAADRRRLAGALPLLARLVEHLDEQEASR
ncbi:MAG: MarR family winged helix-turn-helix transcriptional regulator [Gaiellaceae bacterium]